MRNPCNNKEDELAKVVRTRRAAAQQKDPGSGLGVQKVVYGQVNFILGQGGAHEDISHEDIQQALEEFIEQRWPDSRMTMTGGHYLIDGKEKGGREVCRFDDFDRKTMTRKPGTLPPSYTLSEGFTKKEALAAERILAERNSRQAVEVNELAKQPDNLLTSKELDRVKSSEVVPAPKKKLVRVRRAS